MDIAIITAQFAAEQAAKARLRKQENAKEEIAALEASDHLLFGALATIFSAVEEAYHRGSSSVEFNLDQLFGRGCWQSRLDAASRLLRGLGYKVDFSFSSSEHNERLFLSWGSANN